MAQWKTGGLAKRSSTGMQTSIQRAIISRLLMLFLDKVKDKYPSLENILRWAPIGVTT